MIGHLVHIAIESSRVSGGLSWTLGTLGPHMNNENVKKSKKNQLVPWNSPDASLTRTQPVRSAVCS